VDALDRAIIAHLGSGASLTALRHGRSIDTTMSFTPTGGVLMATRTGDIDPSVLVYLLDQHGYDAAGLQQLIEHESGLVGVSGSSGDMQALLARRPADPAAALAVELFCRDVAKQIGSLAAVLGGVAAVVFTGGVGEHADVIRAAICEPLAHLGIELDHVRNAGAEPVVSSNASSCTVHIVAADEEAVIGRHTAALVLGEPA
jgi:acetate kinase